MTLILGVPGDRSLWILADRRLSYADGQPPKDDARKLMTLEATDGQAVLGYAGLGSTALGTEPADWMASTLRGHNLPLEQMLAVLADAAQRQLPQHLDLLRRDRSSAHVIVAAALVGGHSRLYTIDLVPNASQRGAYWFRFTHHMFQAGPPDAHRPPRIFLAGSGARALDRDKTWQRPLMELVRRYERGELPAARVADYLASLNHRSRRGTADQTVGPNCVVLWRPDASLQMNGSHQCFEGVHPVAAAISIPAIGNGLPLHDIAEAIVDLMRERTEAGIDREKLFDHDAMNERLRSVSDEPDDRLR